MSRTKSDADLQAIRQSVVAAEAALVAVVEYLHDESSPTSEGARSIIGTVLAEHSCISPEGVIVASGIKTHEPHYMGEGPIDRTGPIVIDIYPQSTVTRFFADMTRTVCLGEPSSELLAMYESVQAAYNAAVATLGPGVRCSEVHQAAVDVFIAHNYQTSGVGTEFRFAEGFVHSLGHGVGTAVHEEPTLSMNSDAVLQVGDVITIEPGLYYKHIGGVRLEDLFVITPTGYERLTTLPLELRLQHW